MGKHDITQRTDAGCRGMKIYCQMLAPVLWHFDSYVFMDMMFLQVLLRFLGLHDSVLAKKSIIEFFCLVDPLSQFSEDRFFNSLGGYLKDTGAALELFRASEVIIHPDESVLEKQHYWTSHFLKQELSNNLTQAYRLNKHIDQVISKISLSYQCADGYL